MNILHYLKHLFWIDPIHACDLWYYPGHYKQTQQVCHGALTSPLQSIKHCGNRFLNWTIDGWEEGRRWLWQDAWAVRNKLLYLNSWKGSNFRSSCNHDVLCCNNFSTSIFLVHCNLQSVLHTSESDPCSYEVTVAATNKAQRKFWGSNRTNVPHLDLWLFHVHLP